MLASRQFPASERRREFLRYIVEETLAGRSDRLKGYSIALTVFQRDDGFDSNADPVVRLEARRLRRDLDSYYVDAGASDRVRISIPKGSYVPSFQWHEPESFAVGDRPSEEQVTQRSGDAEIFDTNDARRRRFRGASIAAVSIAAAAIVVALAGSNLLRTNANSVPDKAARGPAVVVMPFEALGTTDDTRFLARGLRSELVSNLFRFFGFRLYSLAPGTEEKLTGSPVKVGRDLGVAYVVNGSVRSDPTEIQISAEVINAANGHIIWTKSYTRRTDPQAMIAVQGDLASEIATAIGQPYGVVKTDLGSQQAPTVSHMQSYMCVLRAYSYRRQFLPEEFSPAMQCLEQAVKRDPDYSDAWAMLGWLHIDAGRLGYTGDAKRQSEYEKALQATSRAATLQPKSPLALKALGATYHYLGRYEESERITRQAAELNPNDPEALAQLGWRLAVRGKFEEGIPLLKRAIERTISPPSWYYHLVAIELYLNRDYKEMLKVSERSALGDNGFSQFLLAVAHGELGNLREAQLALDRMSRFEPVARDPAAYMRRHGAIDGIVDPLMAGLQKARRVATNQ
ncbi:tetratricopeptide repeat protein [Pseudorhodoplanes sp.]|uniref:tetratricopeptide repeat protein n=1 Tax=Pseudorhodoplanes sp. TaxID=1934341 RepID=UPI003D0B9E42